ncbi:ATP-dependent helicase, partial [candidate division KSB1 bacterium]|nr:ATP-dependent helicase [candidate division KSB1 bacterium]
MIILHVSILDNKPLLWAESEAMGTQPALEQALHETGLLPASPADNLKHTAWLPCHGETPVPSSPLIDRKLDKRKSLHLAPCTVVSRPLSLAKMADLLSQVRAGLVRGKGIVYGPSLSWMARLYGMALRILSKETFIPTIISHNKEWQARWIPVPEGEDEEYISALAKQMPAVCRCLYESKQSAPDLPALLLSQGMIATWVDELIRSCGEPTRSKRQHTNVHDAWLEALHSPDPCIHWPKSKEIEALAKQLAEWSRPVDLTTRSSLRFCFRLNEPNDESGLWKVDYLLQPKSDLSTLIDAKEIWKKKSPYHKYLQQSGANPLEFVLTALGQAGGLCPLVYKSLKTKHPTGFELDANGALQFLTDYAQPLRSAGFNVMLPSWWVGRGPNRRLGLKAKTTASGKDGSGRFTLDSIMSFDYRVSLGEQELSLDELLDLARLKEPLVQVRGQWTLIDQKQIQSAIRFLQKQKEHSLPARELLQVVLGDEKQISGLTLDQVEIDGWLKELADSLTGRKAFELCPSPHSFHGALRSYQEKGYSWLAFLRQWQLGACLADDMGLGKTVQTLALIQRETESGETRPVLLVCPTSVVNNWRKEAERFTPGLSVLVHHGTQRSKQSKFLKEAENHSLVVTTYALMQRDIEFLSEVQWAGVVLDEAQNIKNPSTRQFKAARALNSDYRIALTGTPVENHVGDLWSIMDFLNPGMLGSQSGFKTRFKKPIQMYGDSDAAEKLRTLTQPFILRRLKTDKTIIQDLPEKFEIKEYCSLTKEQAALYQAVVDDLQEKIQSSEGINRRGLVLASLMRLKQVCNHPAQYADDHSDLEGRSGKLERLLEMLLEIRELDERTLVFTQFAEMGALLQTYLQDYFGEPAYFLYGGTPRKKRDEMIQRFQ